MVKLIKSTFYNEKETTKKLCDFLLEQSKLSIGDQCQKFEKTFASWQDRKYCTLFNSGSSANLALIQALKNLGKLEDGARVGFSGLTWSTNVMPLIQLSLKPVPLEIEFETLNVSLKSLKETHKKTPLSCLFLTNLLGFSDNIKDIQKFCDENDILLLEDNCESLGSEYDNKKLGNYGHASTFSFFVGHHLSTIEGGAVCTDDKELDTMLRIVRSHGWDRHLEEEEQAGLRKMHDSDDFFGKYLFYDLGYNLRPTEIQGFLGNEQMRHADDIVSKRADNFKKMSVVYNNKDLISLTPKMSVCSNFALPIVCKTKETRDMYLEKCEAVGIETRPIVGGIMTEQPFYKKHVKEIHNLPNTQHIHAHGFYVPNNPELTEDEIALIIETLSPPAI